jgi:hypothetical protein
VPGKVSITADGWSADTTRQGYLGLTGHWIDVMDSGKWVLRSEVVGFRALSGDHSGDNLGRYCIWLCDRLGITGREHSKVRRATVCCFTFHILKPHWD